MTKPTQRAILTAPYEVYLAMHDVDVTLPAGTEFEMFVRHRGQFIGICKHPPYGEIMIDTSDARELP